MYVNPNYQTKKALKEVLAKGIPVEVYTPGLGTIPRDGTVELEGPHYPQPHKWYGTGTMKDGKLIGVK